MSWYEAIAFCRWLEEKLKLGVALPTEAQWERAARHTDGRKYPWGNSNNEVPRRCNILETGIGHTSAVGIFPDGAAKCGAMDMAGNVWEWCRTQHRKDYRDYERQEEDTLEGISARVLRGGGWPLNADFARCACRYGCSPDAWYWGIGFRVVASPSFSEL